MKKEKNIGLDFIVDKLTNSIENTISGDRFPTDISILTKEDVKLTTKRNDWVFIGCWNINNLKERSIN